MGMFELRRVSGGVYERITREEEPPQVDNQLRILRLKKTTTPIISTPAPISIKGTR